MKKIIKLGMVALTALTMAGCSSESEDVKTITVGISPDYAPYESENKKGDIVGFDPDMMKCFEEYLSDEEGVTYKLEMKKMDFDNIIKLMWVFLDLHMIQNVKWNGQIHI